MANFRIKDKRPNRFGILRDERRAIETEKADLDAKFAAYFNELCEHRRAWHRMDDDGGAAAGEAMTPVDLFSIGEDLLNRDRGLAQRMRNLAAYHDQKGRRR